MEEPSTSRTRRFGNGTLGHVGEQQSPHTAPHTPPQHIIGTTHTTLTPSPHHSQTIEREVRTVAASYLRQGLRVKDFL